MNLHFLYLVAEFLQGVPCDGCTRQPLSFLSLARHHLSMWSCVKSGLLCVGPDCIFAPEHFRASDTVLHLTAPVRSLPHSTTPKAPRILGFRY